MFARRARCGGIGPAPVPNVTGLEQIGLPDSVRELDDAHVDASARYAVTPRAR